MIKSGESQPYCHLLVGTIMPLAWDLPWAAGNGGPFTLFDLFFIFPHYLWMISKCNLRYSVSKDVLDVNSGQCVNIDKVLKSEQG